MTFEKALQRFGAAGEGETATATATATGRLLEAQEEYLPHQMALSIIQRIAGALSVLGGLHIFWRAWKRRRRPFDRIMLGLSTHTILWGVYHLWGTAAIPAGTPNIYDAHGTTTTCTAQGFLLQVSMVVPFYYIFLSCYSWVVILYGNFDPARYGWIEKYIHLGVHVFPVGSAIYLLTIEAFNPNGLYCWIASIPENCGDESGIECTRGPSNPHKVLWIFGGMPSVFFLLFPTTVMVALTYCVYLRQRKGVVPCVMSASMVAKQSAIYLGSLYWVYLPLFVYNGQKHFGNNVSYGICLWVSMITNSMGMWFAIVYWYVTVEDNNNNNNDDNDENNCDSDDTKTTKEESALPSTTTTNTDALDAVDGHAPSNENKDDHDKPSILFSTFAKLKNKHNKNKFGSSNAKTTATDPESISRPPMSRSQSRRSSLTKRFSFKIFDGTVTSGMFSAFVFDGDSEDEEKDTAESKQWENCQDMIKE